MQHLFDLVVAEHAYGSPTSFSTFFMRNPVFFRSTTAVLIAASLLGCQREVSVTPSAPTAGKTISQNIAANYPFDWESTTTMPVSASSPTVYVPWQSQGGTPLDPGIVNDYKKSDGWDLVYNSFSPDNFPTAGTRGVVATSTGQPAGGLYFALYNRFRGILRYYMYIPPGFFGSSTQLSHGLQVYTANGSTSKLLNFEAADLIDAAANRQSFTKSNKDGVPTTGGWYAMQYQMAYDPAFANTSYPNLGFKWDTYSLSLSQISLNGTEVGTTKGTITTPAPDFNWADVVTNGVIGIAEIFAGGILKSGKGDFTALQQAAQGGLGGSTTGFFSGIFGGNSANTQTVDLTMNSTITTTGVSSTNQLYESNALRFPGQTNPGTNGIAPLTSSTFGVFNLSDRPVVTLHTTRSANPVKEQDDPGVTYYRFTNSFAVGSTFNSLFTPNPAVINSNPDGASISGLKVEVVVLNPETNDYFSSTATKENFGGYRLLSGTTVNIRYDTIDQDPAYEQSDVFDSYPDVSYGVRVSFHVVPNNTNAPSSFIVKTFVANLSKI